MARNAAPSSRSGRGGSARPSVNAREWLGGIRLSGFTVIMLGLVVLGAFVLVPSVSGYVDMRQQIAQAKASVQLAEDQIAELEQERDRWQDPAFIMSEARERLYYVMPGEVVYLIEDDLPDNEAAEEPEPVNDEASEDERDWMTVALRSIVHAGLADHAVSSAEDVFAP